MRALVTGGGRGVGRALAQALCDAGAKVVICGRDAARLEAAAAQLGAVAAPCDLSHPEGALELGERAVEILGGLDLLINNAGVQVNMSHLDGNGAEVLAAAQDEIATNLTSIVALTAAVMPHLVEAHGAVVNIGSGLALAPKASAPVYCATKAALRTYSRALRYQLEDAGLPVAVHHVLLPLVETDMTAGRGRGKITAEQAATEILAGVRRGRSEIAVGKAGLLPHLLRLAPGLAYAMLRRGSPP
ncbi:SDR family NAD(P)-dependent oxidoreductase [Phenylobacterium sp.]|uniref:SDR family NAD(P)-dependent oxidoreductase n=1 Tax=Phenylobacterium sp. TaxID=1871053 RepID=UPI002FCAB18C